MAFFTASPNNSGVLRGLVVTCDNEAVADLVERAIKSRPTRSFSRSGAVVKFYSTRRDFGEQDHALDVLFDKLNAAPAATVPATASSEPVRVLVAIENSAPAAISRDGRTLSFTGYGRSWRVRHDDFSAHGIDPTMSGEVRYAYYR